MAAQDASHFIEEQALRPLAAADPAATPSPLEADGLQKHTASAKFEVASSVCGSTRSGGGRVRLVECGTVLPQKAQFRRPPDNAEWARTPTGQFIRVQPTTAKLPNRERDKSRVENSLGLPEFGDSVTEFYLVKSGYLPLACGYERVVYGDHGPYVELSPHQICWSSFPNYVERPASCYFDECWTENGLTMLYIQKRTVKNKPNPPAGQFSVSNNCKEGYANYQIGQIYVACEADTVAVRCNGSRRRRRRQPKLPGVQQAGDEEGQFGPLRKAGVEFVPGAAAHEGQSAQDDDCDAAGDPDDATARGDADEEGQWWGDDTKAWRAGEGTWDDREAWDAAWQDDASWWQEEPSWPSRGADGWRSQRWYKAREGSDWQEYSSVQKWVRKTPARVNGDQDAEKRIDDCGDGRAPTQTQEAGAQREIPEEDIGHQEELPPERPGVAHAQTDLHEESDRGDSAGPTASLDK